MTDNRMIDFKRIVRMLLKKSWLFVLALILFAGGNYFFSSRLAGETINYTANGKLLVVQESVETTGQFSDNASRMQPVYDATEVLVSNKFLSKVCEILPMEISPSELRSSIAVEHLTPTRVLVVKVTRESEEEVKAILNAFLYTAKEYMETIMAGVSVNVLEIEDSILVSQIQTGVNSLKVGILMGLAVCIILVIILILLYVWNDTVRYEEEIGETFSIPLMGAVGDSKYSDGEIEIIKLKLYMQNEEVKNVLFTSTVQNEGKSTLLLKLAESMAKDKKKILIVCTEGADILGYDISEKNIQNTNIPGVDIWKAKIEDLESLGKTSEYDYIFLESQALKVAKSGVEIANISHLVLLIIQANRVSKKKICQSVKELEIAKCQNMQVILNRVKKDYGVLKARG